MTFPLPATARLAVVGLALGVAFAACTSAGDTVPPIPLGRPGVGGAGVEGPGRTPTLAPDMRCPP
jgi:hypothetical protein